MDIRAVDVVLLVSEGMADRVIEANRQLVEEFGSEISLNKESCLPHISLAMGCVDEKDIASVEKILQSIANKSHPGDLTVSGIRVAGSGSEAVSAFVVEKTEELQLLHEEVMGKLSPYLGSDVTADMLYGDEEAGEGTLDWIRNYRQKSSFANFWPHITIGCGEIEGRSLPVKFAASELALCHLGNHCTCRKILVSIKLKT